MSTSRAPSFDAVAQGIAEGYERNFVPAIGAPAAKKLLALAAPASGERVLDLACGTGIVARLAAGLVGPEGEVTGLDPNPHMLAVARAAAPDVRWVHARAEDMPLPDDAFDAAVCGMGLQFFEDRPAALREVRRVLAPGGRVALTLPGPTPDLFAAMRTALVRRAGPEAAGFIDTVFGLHDPDEVRGMLEDAGLREAQASSGRATLKVPPAREFGPGYVSGTPLAIPVGRLDDDARRELENEVVAALEPFADDDGLALAVDITVATARA